METLVTALFLTFFFIELIVELALNEINLRHVRERGSERIVPDPFHSYVHTVDYDKSMEYTLAKGRFQRWTGIYGALLTLFVLFGGVLPILDGFSRSWGSFFPPVTQAAGVFFCFGTGAIFSILSLPPDLYSTFVLEERFGFNKTTIRLYFADKLKGLLVGIVIGMLFLFCVLWLMQAAGHAWWIWAFFFIFGFQFLIMVAYPTLIAPLFNKFEPLKQEDLHGKISTLAQQVGLKTSGIYTMDGSRRSSHSNAYFTGVGKAKRIVLFDTLIKSLTDDQMLAVLAHEMGHYKLKHIHRSLALRSIFVLLGLYFLSLLLKFDPLFQAFGLDGPSNHAALVLFTLISGPLTFYLAPLLNRVSRKHEYEADRFAARITEDGKAMEESLIQLTVENLSDLNPHPCYSAYHYSHPTPVERIHALRRDTLNENLEGREHRPGP